jgi:hypothetical protein
LSQPNRPLTAIQCGQSPRDNRDKFSLLLEIKGRWSSVSIHFSPRFSITLQNADRQKMVDFILAT